ncbi:MAG: O-antigen ligase family protein [Chloroflexi bacterium]|nr:O-antigen ligase family protein [Chloroflexota bacterium]
MKQALSRMRWADALSSPAVLWILSALLAISNVGDYEAAALAIAVLGGVAVALAAVLELQSPSTCAIRSLETPNLSVSGSGIRFVPAWLNRLHVWVVANELWLLIAAAPLFLFPRPVFTPVFILLPVLWLLRWRLRGHLTPHTPFDWPIVFLLAMLSVSILVSADVKTSLPKLAGLLFGIGTFYAIVNWAHSEKRIAWVVLGLIGLGIGVGLVGLIGTKWITTGKIIPARVYALLPRAIIQVPGTVQGWIHPNEVGGSLAFIVPFLVVLTLARWNAPVGMVMGRASRILAFLTRRGLLIPLAFTVLIFALTQSRSALFGVAISLLAFVLVRWRRLGAVLVVATVVLLVIGIVRSPGTLQDAIAGEKSDSAVGTLDFAGREEVWSRALYAIQDVPYTGVGLNMFVPVSRALYPYFLTSPDIVLGHAHEIYLQVAVDLGIPGLVAYIALLAGFAYMVYVVYITSRSLQSRALALGLGLGVLAHQIFGLTDAITLGAKPGIILWVMLALGAALWQQGRAAVPFPQPP